VQIAILIFFCISTRFSLSFFGSNILPTGPFFGFIFVVYYIATSGSNFKHALRKVCWYRIEYLVIVSAVTIISSLLPDGIDMINAVKAIFWEAVKCISYVAIYLKLVSLNMEIKRATINRVCWVLIYGCVCTVADFVHRSFSIPLVINLLISPYFLFIDSSELFSEYIFGGEQILLARGCGIAADPNTAGLLAIFSVGFIYINNKIYSSVLRFCLLFVSFLAIVVTFSNSAFLSLSFLVVVIVFTEASFRYRLLTLGLILSITGLLSIGIILLPSDYIYLFDNIINIKIDKYGTAQSHLKIMTDSWGLFLENPFGSGLASYPLRSIDFSSHNSYLQVLVEGGGLGFAAFVRWVYSLFNGGFQRYSQTDRRRSVLVLIVPFIFCLGHDVLNRYETLCIIAILLGVIDNKNT
jgi:O-antigen ligase